jgi:HSP20 family protein
MTAKDVEVDVTEDGVTISGERSYGRFMRQVPLPTGADREKAQATFKEGVLEISFPLKEEAKQKKIEVKASFGQPQT